jgi:hypothetical protein
MLLPSRRLRREGQSVCRVRPVSRPTFNTPTQGSNISDGLLKKNDQGDHLYLRAPQGCLRYKCVCLPPQHPSGLTQLDTMLNDTRLGFLKLTGHTRSLQVTSSRRPTIHLLKSDKHSVPKTFAFGLVHTLKLPVSGPIRFRFGEADTTASFVVVNPWPKSFFKPFRVVYRPLIRIQRQGMEAGHFRSDSIDAPPSKGPQESLPTFCILTPKILDGSDSRDS